MSNEDTINEQCSATIKQGDNLIHCFLETGHSREHQGVQPDGDLLRWINPNPSTTWQGWPAEWGTSKPRPDATGVSRPGDTPVFGITGVTLSMQQCEAIREQLIQNLPGVADVILVPQPRDHPSADIMTTPTNQGHGTIELTPGQRRHLAIGELVDQCEVVWAEELGLQVVLTPEPSWCKNAKGLLTYLKKVQAQSDGDAQPDGDTHSGVSWGAEHPCWHEWPCPTSSSPHRCVFGRGHMIEHHHCPCGTNEPAGRPNP